MAAHNDARVTGYLKKDPVYIEEGDQVIFQLRTTRRDIDSYDEGCFADIMVYCDSSNEEVMDKIRSLKMYDVVEIKGVFNIMRNEKQTVCPVCGETNYKENSYNTFIYPIYIEKKSMYDNLEGKGKDSLDTLLKKEYTEISNNIYLMGELANEPELLRRKKKPLCCRYKLKVDRKYFIKTQDDRTMDFPWIYVYGQQAEWDKTYLHKDSRIMVDAFIQTVKLKNSIVCDNCNSTYSYNDIGTQFIPYAVEYLSDFKTDADIEREQNNKKRAEMGINN